MFYVLMPEIKMDWIGLPDRCWRYYSLQREILAHDMTRRIIAFMLILLRLC